MQEMERAKQPQGDRRDEWYSNCLHRRAGCDMIPKDRIFEGRATRQGLRKPRPSHTPPGCQVATRHTNESPVWQCRENLNLFVVSCV